MHFSVNFAEFSITSFFTKQLRWLLIVAKGCLLLSFKEATKALIDNSSAKSTNTEVILGINLNHESNFNDHTNSSCKTRV